MKTETENITYSRKGKVGSRSNTKLKRVFLSQIGEKREKSWKEDSGNKYYIVHCIREKMKRELVIKQYLNGGDKTI